MPEEQEESSPPPLSESSSVQAPTTQTTAPAHPAVATKRGLPAHPSESPAKKQSKWSADEDALIIELRGTWRAAEAMHWQIGEQEMARRAGVVPFSLSSTAIETPPKGRRGSGTSSRSRRESSTRSGPTQLPSVGELTAGMPAYASPFTSVQEPQRRSPPGPYTESSRQKK